MTPQLAHAPPHEVARGATLEVRGVSKHYGSAAALDEVSLSLPAGQLICFLGPSGCGKTTLLRLIAGLETPSRGELWLDSAELTALPAHQRNIGMVFQSLALFPHLSVAENVAYGLRVRGVGKRERLAQAETLLELVQLAGMGARRVAQLSGGQRQRVAMARALALEPSLFLLDEPLSALDAQLRSAMQVELRELQQRLGVTTILVTHDQEEAMTMADTVVVLGEGRVQQQGTPLEVYHHPANRFVAGFIGTNNFLSAQSVPGGVQIWGSFFSVSLPAAAKPGQQVTLALRPEQLIVSPTPPAGSAFEGRVGFIRDLGHRAETYIDVYDQRLVALTSGSAADVQVGTPVWVSFAANAGTVLLS